MRNNVKSKKVKKKKRRNHEREKAHKLDCQDSTAASFPCLKLHHPANEKKYKICSISEYYVTINHATHRLKRNTSRAVSNANKGKKKRE